MKCFKVPIVLILPLVVSFFFFINCGGGGGSPGVSLSYIGSTAQARITQDNATDTILGAYSGSYGPSQITRDEPTNTPSLPLYLALSQAVEESIRQITIPEPTTRDIVTETQTVTGNCQGAPGSGSYTISVDTNTGAFTGTISYYNYCYDGYSYSGNITLSGQIDPNSDFQLFYRFFYKCHHVLLGRIRHACRYNFLYLHLLLGLDLGQHLYGSPPSR